MTVKFNFLKSYKTRCCSIIQVKRLVLFSETIIACSQNPTKQIHGSILWGEKCRIYEYCTRLHI